MAKDRTLATLLVAHRMAKGWSQEALATATGVSPRTIQRLETGKTQDPMTVELVARALGTTLDRLKAASLLAELLPTMIRVPRVRRGRDLAQLIKDAYGFWWHVIAPDENPELVNIGDVIFSAWEDWEGLLDEPGAMQHAADQFEGLIGELEGAGGKLFGALQKINSGAKNEATGKPLIVPVLMVAICDADYPLILEDAVGECTYLGTSESAEVAERHVATHP